MNITAIDYILKRIEVAADSIGFVIDNCPTYCESCQIITDYQYEGIVPTYEQRVLIAETLETLCFLLKLDYLALMNEAMAKVKN